MSARELAFPVIMVLLMMLTMETSGKGILYPQDSESRETKLLDGIWNFRADFSSNRSEGFDNQWWEKPLSQTGPVIDMPVPASYNDVTEIKDLRDFVGWAWYDRTFFVPSTWKGNRIVIRCDSAHYYSTMWLNGLAVTSHDGGHLPFEADVSSVVSFTGLNRITFAINNTLTPTTLPPGTITYENDTSKYPPGYFVQNLQMDFFNYAGLHRHVHLYMTPETYIDDITIVTTVESESNRGYVHFDVVVGGSSPSSASVKVLDAQGSIVANSSQLTDKLSVTSPHLWWPYGMNSSVGYLYTLEVKMASDVYRLRFGIRQVAVTENQFIINGQPFYCRGVDKHEDSDLRGKGLDYTLITKDFNMLRWMGVNCFRSSHYPYAEEILDFADRQGVAIIDESPGVGIKYVSNMQPASQKHHIEVMGEMIRRDKNRPSVIMWSIANEPKSNLWEAVSYFKPIIKYTKETDPSKRPVTFTNDHPFEIEKVVKYVDVICINRYYAWYSNPGHLELIQRQLLREFEGFRNLYKKPIMVSEYGADTVAGLHREPSFMFTEEYQVEFLKEYHKAFDIARKEYLVGELPWNFADFMTIQGTLRVVGNKKGLLTRQRQPKPAAFVIHDRYHAMIQGKDTSHLYQKDNHATAETHSYSQMKVSRDDL